jgi:hypothetical protein
MGYVPSFDTIYQVQYKQTRACVNLAIITFDKGYNGHASGESYPAAWKISDQGALSFFDFFDKIIRRLGWS